MDEPVEISSFTRAEIINLKFPRKMWILINTPNRVIKWGPQGTSVLIDNLSLGEYLCSSFSIFKTKSPASFFRQMNMYGFQKFISKKQNVQGASSKGIIVEYRHDHFTEGRPDLAGKIFRRSGISGRRPDAVRLTGPQQDLPAVRPKVRMRVLTTIERARLNLRIALQMQAENYSRSLEENLPIMPSSEVSVILLPPKDDEDDGYYEEDNRMQTFLKNYLPMCSVSKRNAQDPPNQLIKRFR